MKCQWKNESNYFVLRFLIWFTVWSSIIHGGIMAVQAVVDPAERANLLGDVPALFFVGIVLAVLMPRGEKKRPKL